jgi:macrolide transport system ATP-binding/permease protein
MQTLWQNLRYGARMLMKKPGFTLIAVISLALGVGANTAIFSVVNAALLRPLPVEGPEALVGLYNKIPQDPNYNRFSYPNYVDVRDRNQSFESLAAYYFTPFNLSGGGQTERVNGKVVSGNYFSTLGVKMNQGRAFLPEEDRAPNANPVAVIGYGLWQRRFGGDPALVGKTITLNGQGFTVVGVTPPQFQGAEVGMAPDVFAPMMMQSRAMPGRNWLDGRGIGWLRVVGRLKPGVSVEQARSEMTALGDQMRSEHPQINESFGIAVVKDFGIHPQFRDIARNFLLILMALVALVLLIACANVASLLLARAAERQQEIGVRLALGAGRAAVIGQLLTESMLLAVLGGVAGLVIAPWLIDALSVTVAQANPMPSPVEFQLDRRVFAFTGTAAVLTGLVFGLAPAISAARTDPMKIIKGDTAGRSPVRTRLRSIFVGAQVALSLALLVAAGLFIRSLQSAQRIDVGFDTERQLLLRFDLGLQGYDRERGRAFAQQLEQRVAGLPGVQSVTFADVEPLGLGSDQDTRIAIDGYTPPSGLQDVTINYNVVGSNYFQTMNIPLVQGRDFGAQDHEKSLPVAIVNETAARRFWPNQPAVGRRVRYGSRGPEVEVIGVARDSKYITLGEGPTPYLYMPMSQSYLSSATLQARVSGDPSQLIDAAQREVQALDKDLPVFGVKTMRQHLQGALMAPGLAAALLGVFGAVAMLLAAVGIYGVVSYVVAGRTREFGLRMALGARPRNVAWLALRGGMTPVWIGIVIGLGASLAATRLLESFLYGVSASDPMTYAAAAALLGAVALLASFIPARRATKVDPMVALRVE